MKKAFLSKALSFLLVISILLVSSLFSGFTLDNTADTPPEATTEKAVMLDEDVTKRTENERHFHNSDGSYTAIQYSNPVNFMQNGKWEEINNDLSLTRDGTFRNTNAPVDVRLSQNLDGGLADGHKIISYSFHGGDNQQWQFSRYSDGSYRIYPPSKPNLTLDIWGGGPGAGSELRLGGYVAGYHTNQRFFICDYGDGRYIIAPAFYNHTVLAANSSDSYIKTAVWGNGSYLLQTWTLAQVDAFTDNGGLSNRTVTIKLVSGLATDNSSWNTAIENARVSWNNSGAGVSITTTTSGSSPHTLEVAPYPITWDGWCYKNPTGNVVATSSEIVINTLGDHNLGLSGVSNTLRQAAVAHEMGHLFWLNDNPATNQYSLMIYDDIFIGGIYLPLPFDVYNIKFRYD